MCECVCVRVQYYLVISRRTNVTCRARTVTEYDDDDARATGRRGSASTAFHSVLWTRVRSPVCPILRFVRVRDAAATPTAGGGALPVVADKSLL